MRSNKLKTIIDRLKFAFALSRAFDLSAKSDYTEALNILLKYKNITYIVL